MSELCFIAGVSTGCGPLLRLVTLSSWPDRRQRAVPALIIHTENSTRSDNEASYPYSKNNLIYIHRNVSKDLFPLSSLKYYLNMCFEFDHKKCFQSNQGHAANRNLLQLHLKTTRGIYGNKKLEQMKERGSTSFKNNQSHLFENKKIEPKKERWSESWAGDLPGCQLEANCPGPEEVDYQNIDSCESLAPEEVDYQG